MQIFLSHIFGRILRLLPKHRNIKLLDMAADFFVPINNHYICEDLHNLNQAKRESKLYEWLNGMEKDSILFDIGTSYGQEASLASSFVNKGIAVIGFDCGLYQSHFCCLNKALNQDQFRFIFTAVSNVSGEIISVTSNSDTHIRHLHKKTRPILMKS